MKNIIIILVVCLFLCVSSIANEAGSACYRLQNRAIENLNDIGNCTGGSYGISTYYLIKGVVQGKCHYEKGTFSKEGLHTVAHCYAPMSTMRYFADEMIHEAKEMCNSNGIAPYGYESKASEATLDAYCKKIQLQYVNNQTLP